MRGLGAALGATVLSLALAGCGEDAPSAGSLDPASDADTTGATSPPATEESTSAEPSPDDAGTDEDGRVTREGDDVDAETAAAAEAFVAEFLKTYDRAALSGDVSAIESMFTDECARCIDNVAFLTDLYGQGRHIEGAQHTKLEFTTMGSDAGAIMVRVQLVRAAYTVEDDEGSEYDSGPAEPRTLFFRVIEESGAWSVVNWSGDR